MDLSTAMRKALAEVWTFYFMAHSFHWNVTGPMFAQFHDFFGRIYDDAHDAVDDLAEHIRAMGEMAPASLGEIAAPATIKFTPAADYIQMVDELSSANAIIIGALEEAQNAAEEHDDDGLSNFLQDRLDKHAKWGWMLTASKMPRGRSPLHDHPRSTRSA